MKRYNFENKTYLKLSELIGRIEGAKTGLVQAVCRAAKKDDVDLYQSGRSWYIEISAENLAWLDSFLVAKYGSKSATSAGLAFHHSEPPVPDREIVEKIVEVEKEVPVIVEKIVTEFVEVEKVVIQKVEKEASFDCEELEVFSVKSFGEEWAWVAQYAKWARLVFGVVLSLMLVQYLDEWILKFVNLPWLISLLIAFGLSAGLEFGIKEPVLKKAVIYFFKKKIANSDSMMAKYFGRMAALLAVLAFLFVLVDVVGTFKGADKWLKISDYESKEMDGAKVDSFVINPNIGVYSDSIGVLSKKLEGLKNDWSPAAKSLVPVYRNDIELLRVELAMMRSADSLARVEFDSTRRVATGTAVASFEVDGWVLAVGSVVLQLLLLLAIYFEGWYWAGVCVFRGKEN